jgi:hypothetical protein
MKCEQARDKFADALAGELSADEHRELDLHIAACPACGSELRALSETWARLGVLPVERPSANLRARFYEMLEASQAEIAAKGGAPRERLRPRPERFGFWFRRPAFQAAAAAGLVALGVLAGVGLGRLGPGRAASVDELYREVQDVRQTLAVSLMKQASPFDRLEGVGLSRQLASPSPNYLEALFQALDNDSNVNVRLAVVDALYFYAGQPEVKERIFRSLETQQSPLVQAALVDLLVGMRERQAVEALRRLIQNQNLHPQVRQRAEQGIVKLET